MSFGSASFLSRAWDLSAAQSRPRNPHDVGGSASSAQMATVSRMPALRTYRPDERPDVEVLVDGQWCKGELRQWSNDDSNWSAQVQWRRTAGETFIDTFPADRIRPDETSYRST